MAPAPTMQILILDSTFSSVSLYIQVIGKIWLVGKLRNCLIRRPSLSVRCRHATISRCQDRRNRSKAATNVNNA